MGPRVPSLRMRCGPTCAGHRTCKALDHPTECVLDLLQTLMEVPGVLQDLAIAIGLILGPLVLGNGLDEFLSRIRALGLGAGDDNLPRTKQGRDLIVTLRIAWDAGVPGDLPTAAHGQALRLICAGGVRWAR